MIFIRIIIILGFDIMNVSCYICCVEVMLSYVIFIILCFVDILLCYVKLRYVILR